MTNWTKKPVSNVVYEETTETYNDNVKKLCMKPMVLLLKS